MSLREIAINEYKKEQKTIEENNVREAEDFSDKAVKEFLKIVGIDNISGIVTLTKESHVFVVEKGINYTILMVDDIRFKVYASQYYVVIEMMQTCPICGSTYFDRITNIKDIGKMLVRPHSKFDCDSILDIKKRATEKDFETQNVSSTEKRLLEALKDFISEQSDI